MGIDSIRGGPPVSPPAAGGEPSGAPADGAHGSFRAEAALPSAKADAPAPLAPAPGMQAVIPVAPSILDQVRSGQIDVARYLDLKVEEATAHLRALPAGQLESIRSALRDRLAADPALAGLVEVATGHLLPPDDG